MNNFADPDSLDKTLAEAPAIEASASVRDTSFGKFCEVGARTKIAESSFGDYAYVANDSDIIYSTIGKFCSIAAHVRINPGNHPLERAALHHFTYRASAYGFGEDEADFFEWRRGHRVTLGNDVWVGHGVTILPGIAIGDGAAIGAGAVVSRDVPPFAIAVGVPAKTLRFRFPAAVVASLTRLAWWDWEPEALRRAVVDFRRLSAAGFCAKYDSAFGETA